MIFVTNGKTFLIRIKETYTMQQNKNSDITFNKFESAQFKTEVTFSSLLALQKQFSIRKIPFIFDKQKLYDYKP